MRLTLERDDGRKEVFQDVVDLYLAVRQLEPVTTKGVIERHPRCYGKSYGSNVRELVKELRQGLVELEEHLAHERAAYRQRVEEGAN